MAMDRHARIISRAEQYAAGEIDLQAFVLLEELDELDVSDIPQPTKAAAEVVTKATTETAAKPPTKEEFAKLVSDFHKMSLIEKQAIYNESVELFREVSKAASKDY